MGLKPEHPSFPQHQIFDYRSQWLKSWEVFNEQHITMTSLTLLQLAQVVATSCVVASGLLLLLFRCCARRPSRNIVIEEAIYVAQPVRIPLSTRNLRALSSMRRDELVAECKARNLPINGTVKELRSLLRVERSRDNHDEVVNRRSRSRHSSRASRATTATNSS